WETHTRARRRAARRAAGGAQRRPDPLQPEHHDRDAVHGPPVGQPAGAVAGWKERSLGLGAAGRPRSWGGLAYPSGGPGAGGAGAGSVPALHPPIVADTARDVAGGDRPWAGDGALDAPEPLRAWHALRS